MAEQKTKQRRIRQSEMSQREAHMLRAVCSSLASYRRSMFFRWLILTRVHKSRLSTLFPAIASLSTTLNLSSTAGTWEKLLKESPRLLSWNRPPISSGRELRWFPSKDSVCRLREEREKTGFSFFYFRERTKYLLTTICICIHYLSHSVLGNAAWFSFILSECITKCSVLFTSLIPSLCV